MLRLRASHARACYALFRALPPFCRWRLPAADAVEFRVISSRDVYGTYQIVGGKHRIAISRYNVKSFHALAVTMAHEMLHLRQAITQTFNDSQHNREFLRLAKRVCLTLGFDSAGFV